MAEITAHRTADYTVDITFASDDDDRRQKAYDILDAAFARVAAELWHELGDLLVVTDTCADLDVAGVGA
jgi:hypothetical protein